MMRSKTEFSERLALALGAMWLATLLLLVTFFGSVRPLDPPTFAGVALAGQLYVIFFRRERLRFVLESQRVMLGAATCTVLLMLVAGWALELRHPDASRLPLPAQVGLLLCIAPLAVVLGDRILLRAMVAWLAAMTIANAFALPYEALTGERVFAWCETLFPRDLGPLHYQAHGLAWQVYYFAGLNLGAFYLAAGAIGEDGVAGRWRLDARSWLAFSLAWAACVACVQSRSVLAGAMAASLAGLLAFSRVRHARVWAVAGAILAAGVVAYWLLFSENKSSGSLRWAYLVLFFQHSFDAQWLWTGRGYTIVPDMSMQVPGMQFVVHSHNDIVQTFYTWGLPTVAAYIAFLATLVFAAARSARHSRYWPMLALIAVAPSFMTDLGTHHLEKMAFLAVFAGLVAVLASPARVNPQPP